MKGRLGWVLVLLLVGAPVRGQTCPCLPPPCVMVESQNLDLKGVCTQLEQLQAKVAVLEAQAQKKGLVQTLLMNRYVDMLLAAVVAAVTVQVMR